MSEATLCGVCKKQPHKYKCAKCRALRYCSTECFNAHVQKDCPAVAPSTSSSATAPPSSSSSTASTAATPSATSTSSAVSASSSTDATTTTGGPDHVPHASVDGAAFSASVLSPPATDVSQTLSAAPAPAAATPAAPVASPPAPSSSTTSTSSTSASSSSSTSSAVPVHRLGQSDSVRRALRSSSELRSIVAEIDSAGTDAARIAALTRHLKHNKDFEVFVQEMLDAVQQQQ